VSNTRKIILIIVIAFVVYAVFTRPGQSADSVDWAWGLVKDGADSVTTFFDALLT
jgi:hypothetical protein